MQSAPGPMTAKGSSATMDLWSWSSWIMLDGSAAAMPLTIVLVLVAKAMMASISPRMVVVNDCMFE